MQTLRHKRLARQLNDTAMALIAEARVVSPDDAKELRELATEIDRVRITYFAGPSRGEPQLTLHPVEAA